MPRSKVHTARARVAGLVVCLLLVGSARASAQGRSPLVLNCDGAGTTIVKNLGGSSFQVQQLWATNAVNGIQSFTDGSFAFVNCTPSLRTRTEQTLSCSVFDAAVGRWGEPPIVTTVGIDFLSGDLENPFNSLPRLTGEYLTIFPLGAEEYTFRMRFLDAVVTQEGFPLLIGDTSPQSRAFLLRNVDVAEGTTNVTNFSIAMQASSVCFDFDVSPIGSGGILAGTVGGRVLGADGSCGQLIEAGRPVTIVPSSVVPPGGRCRYRVEEVGRCTPGGEGVRSGDTICLPCTGVCRDFTGDVDIVFQTLAGALRGYDVCEDVVVVRIDPECFAECPDGLRSFLSVRPGSEDAAATASALFSR